MGPDSSPHLLPSPHPPSYTFSRRRKQTRRWAVVDRRRPGKRFGPGSYPGGVKDGFANPVDAQIRLDGGVGESVGTEGSEPQPGRYQTESLANGRFRERLDTIALKVLPLRSSEHRRHLPERCLAVPGCRRMAEPTTLPSSAARTVPVGIAVIETSGHTDAAPARSPVGCRAPPRGRSTPPESAGSIHLERRT
jgi:hypothetical protein